MKNMKSRLKIHFPIRRSTADPVGNAILSFDDRTMVLDTQNMQAKLYRLLPHAYAHASADEWVPFVTLAIAMGML